MSSAIAARLVRRVTGLRGFVAALAALELVGAALVVARAVLLADLVAAVFSRNAAAGVVVAPLVAVAAVGAGNALLSGAREYLGARASVRVRAELRHSTLAAVVRLGPLWGRCHGAGRLVNSVGPAIDALDGYVTRALPALVSGLIVPPVVLTMIVWSDWQSGVILLVLLPLVPLFLTLVGVSTGRRVRQQYAALDRLSGHFLDLLRGLSTLRAYGRADAQEATLRALTDKHRSHTLSALRTAFLSGMVLDLLAALSVAVVAVDVGLRLDAGHVSFVTAVVVLLLAPELFAPLRALGAQHHAREEGGVAAAAALDIIDEAPAPGSATQRDTLRSGRIVFDGVTVAYPGRDVAALCDVSLTFEPGRVVALTGANGSGKSTVLAALLGFVPLGSGAITAENGGSPVSLDPARAGSWRESVAWLPQRPRPSRPTVGEEIRLGDPNADDVAVARACRDCGAPAPATLLAEDGLGVSAGQRRRIALARALLRARCVRASGGVPLVLLDEPSEDLDRDTEATVAQVIDGLRGWATVLVASHSPVLAALADVRVLLVDGRVACSRAQTPAPIRAPARIAAQLAPAPAGPALTAVAPAVPAYRLRSLIREADASRPLLLAGLLTAATACTGLALTATSMWLISRAAQHPNLQELAVAVVGVRTFAIGRALLRYRERLASHDCALRMIAALRVRVFASVRTLSPRTLAVYGRGDLLRRFVGDVDGAQEVLVRAVVPLIGASVGAAAAVTLAAILVPGAALVLAAGLMLAGLVVPVASFRLADQADRADRLATAGGRRDRESADVIEALDELLAYGAAGVAVDRVVAADRQVTLAARRPALVAALGVAGSGMIAAFTLAAVVAAAAQAVMAGLLPVVYAGVLAVCVLSGFEAVAALPSAFVARARCRAGLDRVADVIERQPDWRPPAEPATLPAGALGLVGSELTVAPAARAPAVLGGAALDLPAGARLAVVGPSGCGKSTLLGAALRMLPLRGGSFTLDAGAHGAVALRDLAALELPTAVAGSLQGDHVFDASLRDNLRFVRPDASDADLDAVAARVKLLDTVHNLSAGWSTAAGPDGAALSGGQRQRLLLARALLAAPRILVLDEPTAHLDAETERSVLADLLDATAGRTVLMSTHRRLAPGQLDAELEMIDKRLVSLRSPVREPPRTDAVIS